jgi:hypothetical protein
MAGAKKWPGSQVPSQRWYGQQLCISARPELRLTRWTESQA